jgi:sporulation protein YlmC with PRC-barrel domain
MKTSRVSPWIHLVITASLVGAVNTGFGDDAKGLLGSVFSGSEKEARAMTAEQVKMALSVRDYLGLEIINEKGQRLGEITDLTLKHTEGGFDRAVVSVGGVVGIGRVFLAVPFADLERRPGAEALVWKVSPEQYEELLAQARPQRSNSRHAKSSDLSGTDKASSDVDVRRAHAAIKGDRDLQSYAQAINVEKVDGRLVVEGAIESKAQKEKLLALVRTATSCEVVDELEVN